MRKVKDLILFHDLEPGSYELRLVKLKDLMCGQTTLALPKDCGPVVDVNPRALHYLGVVRTRFGTTFNSGFEVQYDPASELAAWKQFKKAFDASPWVSLANEKITSGGKGAEVQISSMPDEPSFPPPTRP